ncbi:MAG: PAS domain S-box protein, partial [Magnetospirillum sp.]|nr:PAS domain S-box protein [Magnetospirillum sp.]
MMSLPRSLERLRLSTKLILGFTTILLLAVGLGVFSLHAQKVQNDEIQRLYTIDLQGISDIKDARIDLAKMGRALRQAILARETAERERALRQLGDAEADLRREIENSRKTITREENKRNLAKFVDNFRIYKANLDQAQALLTKSPAEAAAYVATSDFQIAAAAADDALEAVVQVKERSAHDTARLAQANYEQGLRLTFVLIFGCLGLGVLCAMLISLSIRRPAGRVREVVEKLAAGERDLPVPHTDFPNEIGELARSIEVLRDEARQMESQRWIKTHLADISGELQEPRSQVELARRFLSKVAPLLKVGHGAFYLMNETGDRLALLGSYAHRERKCLEQGFAIGEGLVGQCALERTAIIITQPPDDYIRIETGTAEMIPKAITVLPVMRGERLLAVVELATMKALGPAEQALLDGAMPLLAMSIEIIERTVKTQQLLAETQIQAATLAASERQINARKLELETINEQLAEQGRLVEEQAEDLGRERSLLRSLIDSIPDMIYVKDMLGVYLVSNQAFASLVGKPSDEIIGKTDFDIFPQGVAEYFRDRDIQIARDGQRHTNEEEVDYPDGRHAHLETTKVPLSGPDGALMGLIGVARDITERKLADIALYEAEERSRLILGSINEGIAGLGIDGKMSFINPAGARMLGYELDELVGQLMHPTVHQAYPDGTAFPREKCPMYHTSCDGQPRTVDDEVLWRKDGTSFPVEYTTTPVMKDGNVVGTVVSFRDITERKAAEERLNRANFQADIALDLTGSGFWQVDYSDPEYYYQSERAANILGEEIKPDGRYHLANEWFNRLVEANPETARLTEERYLGAVEGRYDHYDSVYAYKRPSDGRIVWIHAAGKLVRDDAGTIRYMYGAYQDVTKEKEAAEALAVERERLQAILDKSPISIAITTNGVIRFANPIVNQKFGFHVGDKAPDVYVHQEDRDALLAKMKRDGIVANHEVQMWSVDKTPLDMLVTYMPLPYDGETGVLAWLLDITERKQAENAIRDQAAFQEALVDTIPYPLFYKGPDARFLGFNRAYEQTFGVRRQELIGKNVLELDYLPEADRIIYQAEDEAVIATATSVEKEVPIPFADGKVHDTLYYVSGFRKADGAPGGLVGTFVDVSDRKKVEEIERFNRLAQGREGRIVDLKRQVNALSGLLGQGTPFQSPEQADEMAGTAVDVVAPAALDAQAVRGAFIELLRENELQELFSNFCEAVGIAAAIIDPDANILASSRWQRVCTDFHRVNEKSCAKCIESDTGLSLNLSEGKDYAMYRCKNGMTDCASPIIVAGHHIANVFIGQFHTGDIDESFFIAQADELGFERGDYLMAVREAPVMDEARLPSILGFLARFAKLVGSFAVEQWKARQAEISIRSHAVEASRERIAAISLAEDADHARAEVVEYKEHLEDLV